MLILNRKVNDTIVLNGVIRIMILATEPNKVKIGIEAPPDVIIVREELLNADRLVPKPTFQTGRLPTQEDQPDEL